MAGWNSGKHAPGSRSSGLIATRIESRTYGSAWITPFCRSPSVAVGAGWRRAAMAVRPDTLTASFIAGISPLADTCIRFFTKGGPVGELAFTPTGHLLTADWSGTVALWEPLEGRLVRDWPRPHTGNVYHSLAVNAAGQIALQRENGVYLWHPDPNQETMLCPARGFSPAGLQR